jgi:hypothetical protein
LDNVKGKISMAVATRLKIDPYYSNALTGTEWVWTDGAWLRDRVEQSPRMEIYIRDAISREIKSWVK